MNFFFPPTRSATNTVLETGYFLGLEEVRHQAQTEYKPPDGSFPIFICVYTLEVSCRYIMPQLSFLSMGIAVVAPRKRCSYEAIGNEILSSMKCNFTERLKNLFFVWQICYSTHKYTKYKNNKIYMYFFSNYKN